MNTHHRFGLAAVFIVCSAIVSIVTAPDLPAELVSHWNTAGEPDGTMAKPVALWLLPALSAGSLLLFALIPRIDPLGANIAGFRASFDWFAVVFTAFLFVLHVGIIAFNLGYEFDFTSLIVVLVAGLFYYCGFVLTRANRNWFVGIRTPWTLSNEEVWDRTHALGGKLFKLTALVGLVGLLFGEYAIYFLIVPALLTALVTVGYSYYLYEQVDRNGDSAPDTGL